VTSRPATVRTIGADEIDRYYDVDAAAFGVLNEPEFLEAKRTVVDPDRFHLAEVDGEPVGAAGSFPFDLTLPGGATVPVCGISDVGVLPTHRRRGVLRSLLTRQLDVAAAAGEPAAVLSASEATIYGRFGFGVATRWRSVVVPTFRSAFRADAPTAPGRLRIVRRGGAAPVLAEVYRRATRPGWLSRSDAWWDIVLGDTELFIGGHRLHQVMVHEGPDGAADAYAIYRIEERWPDSGPAHRLVLTEIVGTSVGAELALWRGLLDHDLVAEVSSWLPTDHLLFDVLADPRATVSSGERDFLWLRPLDVAALLSSRTYGSEGRVVLDVTDPTRPDGAAAGTFVLDVDDGTGRCRRDDAAGAGLALDVSELGSTVLGGSSFRRLVRAGRVRELRAGAAAEADALFGLTPLPWTWTRF
jgi:predicted acetyltransferase